MIRQFELVERVRSYIPDADEDALNRAYVFAMKQHGSQTRASGDPYFSHPVEVAGILTDYRLDTASIITALLHDVVEDTDATIEQVDRIFGPEVARLVDGVTKLARIQLQSDQSKQAENFRKLVLAMSDDIRVLLVKLADRLHNMRTLRYVKNPDSRRRISLETMEIYAPLAERIGMQEIRAELEDLAFGELNPDGRDSVMARLAYLRSEGGDLAQRIRDELAMTLARNAVVAQVEGREKTPYSIWRKMQRKAVEFEQLSDIMAFRVLVDDMETCYRVLGVMHSTYPMVPGRFKDYISTPKPNGYRSLHTGVIGPDQQRIEVQIRTHAMHEVAERGVAAHWSYKEGTPNTEGRQYGWLRELLDILEHASSPEEFLEHTKLAMFSDQVFCFTPKGDLISLPAGATPVDFAYAVHTEVGDRCIGCKVNGRMVPLRTVLANGDQVEVITSKVQKPSPDWENFVVSAKARAHIRRFIRNERRDQYVTLGREILDRAFRQAGTSLTEKVVDPALRQLRLHSVDDLYAEVGQGSRHSREILGLCLPALKPKPTDKVVPISRARTRQGSDSAVPIRGLIPGMAMHFGRCCHPLPGDRIVGIVTTGKGVTIHTIDCDMLARFAEEPERWLDLSWGDEAGDGVHVGRVNVVVTNEPGSLGTLSTVIARNDGNISNLKITSRSPDFFDLMLDIEVHDVRHLTNIIAALRASPPISYVERARK